ncbi:MAG TPA: protoporphyrinogen oxidase [Thermodesulfobacteriota bacterium]|nr:protoporphyrinogen oxidase [Thermodesulfobacteriota bacterium]
MKQVVVAGAGISGLAVAHALRTRGVEPLVFERETRAGGKIRSEVVGGFLCEWGPTGFSGHDPAVRRLVRDLGLEAHLLPASPAAMRRCVVVGGRIVPVPTSLRELLRSDLLPRGARLRLLADLLLPRGPAGRGEVESVAAFATRRLGRTAAERVVYPLLSGLYPADPEQVSLPDAFPGLAALERTHRSLLLALAARREGLPGAGLASLRGGVEELVRALAVRHADLLRLGVAVRRVEPRDGRFRVQVDDRGRSETVAADAVVLAVPAYAAAAAVASFDTGLAAALAAIPYVPVTLVHAGYAGAGTPTLPDVYGFFVPPSEPCRLLGAVFASVVFAGRAPQGGALVTARIGGARSAALGALPDRELAGLVREELQRLLGIEARPAVVRIVRHEQALPQYTLEHRERLAALEAAERRYPGLFFAGNAYRGLGLADCVRNAAPLADRVVALLKARRPAGVGESPSVGAILP